MNGIHHPSEYTRRRFLLAGMSLLASSCATKIEPILLDNPKERLRILIQKTKVSYNGKEHNFPNDAIIDGPDQNGIYTVSSEKLKKVTKDIFQFDNNMNLLTQKITISIDSFDFLTATVMRAKFGIENGDICTVSYENQVVVIKKI